MLRMQGALLWSRFCFKLRSFGWGCKTVEVGMGILT